MQECKEIGVTNLNKDLLDRIKDMDEAYYIENLQFKRNIFYRILKRTIDIVGAFLGLIITSPICIITAIVIKLDSKGPIIFLQDRVGIDGVAFKMYKFRSMVVNAEDKKKELFVKNEMSGPMFKMKNDPRVTSVGKFIRKTSIDELPQLINILKGDMSLVGPRPNLPQEVERFTTFQRLKLKVKPGLTCYWQVMGRSSIDFEDWMRLDIKYIEDRNTFLDIKLILKTVKLLFGDKNAR